MDNKLFAVYKPKGITSAKFLNEIRLRISKSSIHTHTHTHIRLKIGHAGTLDPNASGVLIVGTGSQTKSLNGMMKQDKEYIATICFGSVSDTYDDMGTKVFISDLVPELKIIESTLTKFIGIVDQVPPAYSAIHIDGRRAYKLARSKVDFVIPSRKVTIHSIEVLEYCYPILKIKVKCGSGTYIRSIAKDIGDAIGCGAYLKDLERTISGVFSIKDCIDLPDITILSLPSPSRFIEHD
jgi:tRNA pseudouridine55 synthase